MTPEQIQVLQAQRAQQAQAQPTPEVMQQDPSVAMQNAEMATQAAKGLGTPPDAKFEYKPNPSMALMDAHVSKQQQTLAVKAQEQQAEADKRGYAGRSGEALPSSGSNEQAHPNAGWNPSSEEAHQLNIQLAYRIQSGQIDAHTAVLAMQSPEVAPELKQALSQIVQQAQGGSSQESQPTAQQEPSSAQVGTGLGSMPQ